jgi:hypothetical protein
MAGIASRDSGQYQVCHQNLKSVKFLYSMGGNQRAFITGQLPNDNAKVYDIVLQRFNSHFIIQKNVIF